MLKWKAQDHLGPLAEYDALRQEVLHLLDLQWKVTFALITSVGAVFGFALSSPTRTAFLLAVPFLSHILLFRWLVAHSAMERIAKYTSDHLSLKVPGGLDFERWRRMEHEREARRFLQLAWRSSTVLAFPGLSALALTAVLAMTDLGGQWSTARILGATLWALGLILTVLCLAMLWWTQRYVVDQYRRRASNQAPSSSPSRTQSGSRRTSR